MSQNRHDGAKGFVMTAVLMLLLIGLLVAGAFMISARQTLRTVDRWNAYDHAMLMTKTATEKVKWNLYNALLTDFNSLDASFTNDANWIKNNAYRYSTNGSMAAVMAGSDSVFDSYTSAFVVAAITNGTVVGSNKSATIFVTNVVQVTVNGVTRKLEETIKYVLTRSTVFEYAYFINQFGYFIGVDIVVNGDIRSNFDMRLDSDKLVLNGNSFALSNRVTKTPITWNYTQYRSDTNHAFARPGYNVDLNASNPNSVWTNGYNPITYRSNSVDKLKMPYIGNVEELKTYAIENNGTITNNSGVIVNAVWDENQLGPSGYSNIFDMVSSPTNGIVNAADRGCLVLVGTSNNPIRINGPVFIGQDLIIKGFYTGQGTIYVGRNVHIIADVRALNPPTWKHPDASTTATFLSTTYADNIDNKDYLALCAKGSIVLGNYTQPGYTGSYFKVTKYDVSATDASIGYVSSTSGGTNYFHGDYTSFFGTSVGAEGTNTVPRRYYQSSVSTNTLTSLGWSPSITRLDATLYNNHLTTGKLGTVGTNCIFNGAVICRNEALAPLSGSKIYFNWDPRLGEKDSERFKTYLPMKLTQVDMVKIREIPVP
jgi:hypothetical protein